MIRYIARFDAQAYVRGDAVSVDAEGKTEWDCTKFVTNPPDWIGKDYFAQVKDGAERDEMLDNDDVLTNDSEAPKWIQDWKGPFSIWVRKVDFGMVLSPEAKKLAAELGVRAANDSAIFVDDIDADEAEANDRDVNDYGEFSDEHRRLWEETDQFQQTWLVEIIDISEADFITQGGDRSTNNMLWYEEFQEPAKAAFWDAWEEKVGLYEFWKEHHQTSDTR